MYKLYETLQVSNTTRKKKFSYIKVDMFFKIKLKTVKTKKKREHKITLFLTVK